MRLTKSYAILEYLHVPVNYLVHMEIIEGVDELLGDLADFFFRQRLVIFKYFK